MASWLHLTANLICQNKHSQEIYQPDVTMVTVIGGLCALCLQNKSSAGLQSFEYWHDINKPCMNQHTELRKSKLSWTYSWATHWTSSSEGGCSLGRAWFGPCQRDNPSNQQGVEGPEPRTRRRAVAQGKSLTRFLSHSHPPSPHMYCFRTFQKLVYCFCVFNC
jgi:hypothetical protein